MDEDFRMVFLFQEVSCSDFINEFEARQLKMLEFLVQLEECAVQLDNMCKGAKISSVTGSSVGAVGGVFSIVGLALIPVTAGVSFGFIVAGVVMGVTSGVNSAVTTATEIGVNITNQNKANEVFQNFMEDIQVIQNCLEKVTNQPVVNVKPSKLTIGLGVGKIVAKGGAVVKGTDAITDSLSILEVLTAEQVVTNTSKVLAQEGKALRNIPKVASDVPDISQAAVKGPLALSKGARVGFIAANALFLGLDIVFICKDSMSLAKGSETKVSKLIRARAELWRSEINSWEKLRDSLSKGLKTSAAKRKTIN